jgi:prepilin-type N-terminal cleavage/methylation domain-containing protein
MISSPRQGFTLIEISIVLVIIGLVIGGVLVGKELVFAAQVRAQVTQIEQLNTAVATFRSKYACLPGDCATAEDRGLGLPGDYGNNGNGSGVIGDATVTPPEQTEGTNFWYHLYQAGLIVEDTSNTTVKPKLAGNVSGDVTIVKETDLLYVTLGNPHLIALAATNGSFGLYLPSAAYAIDSKMDNGLPTSGTVQAISALSTQTCQPPPWGAVCLDGPGTYPLQSLIGERACINDINPGSPVYNFTQQNVANDYLCNLVIRPSF